MAIRDVKQAIDETSGSETFTRVLDDDEVMITVRAGRARVTITAGKNQVTIQSDKVLETDKVYLSGKLPVLDEGRATQIEDETLDSAVMVLSQINEA